MYEIPRVFRIIAAEMNVIDNAALWLQAHKTRCALESWEEFCVVMQNGFGTGTDQQPSKGVEDCPEGVDSRVIVEEKR